MNMRLLIKLIFLLVISVNAFVVAAHEQCEQNDKQIAAALNLTFEEFDQMEASGWRPLYENKCYKEAAKLIVRYMAQHPELVKQHYMLPFHAGQMYALHGEYQSAINYMQLGYSDIKSEYIDWNAFVDANIAFLNHDLSALQQARVKVAQQPKMPDSMHVPDWAIGKKMNLDVVDGFILCFDKPYVEAYSMTCRKPQ